MKCDGVPLTDLQVQSKKRSPECKQSSGIFLRAAGGLLMFTLFGCANVPDCKSCHFKLICSCDYSLFGFRNLSKFATK